METKMAAKSTAYKPSINVFFFLYFLQGLPYGLQSRFLPLYFRAHGMSLANISLYKLLLIPWVLKAIWAPFVDGHGQKRTWLLLSLALLGIVCLIGSFIPQSEHSLVAGILFIFNLLTSAQDIAVDGLLIEVLDSSQLAYGNAAQVVGYKAGSLFSGGVFAWFIDTLSWSSIFHLLAIVYVLGVVVSVIFFRKPFEHQSSAMCSSSEITSNDTFTTAVFKTEGTLWMMLFMVLYKTGEQGVLSLFPLYLLDKAVHANDVGFWTGVMGQCLSIFGSGLGALIFRLSTLTSLKVYFIGISVCELLIWMIVQLWNENSVFLYGSSIFTLMVLSFFSGAVTTCTFTLGMKLSQKAPKKYRTSHYTILATTEVLGKLLFSSAVGSLAQYTSYSFSFGLFFLLTLFILPMIFNAPKVVIML